MASTPENRLLLSDRQDDSSILGAAVLPIYEMLSPRLETLQQDRRGEADVAELLGHQAPMPKRGVGTGVKPLGGFP